METDFFRAKILQNSSLPEGFFDMMIGPSVYSFFNQYDIDYLKDIILNGKNDIKLKIMNGFMASKGFSRFAAGTNRVVYRYLEDPSFLIKVALDRTGLQDNIKESINQNLLKPFVTKLYSTTPDGLIATVERCIPITRKDEFEKIIDEVFYTTVAILGKYVLEDIGKAFFKNWAVRPGFGPVLCDYPYVYKVDEAKLFCTKIDLMTGLKCGGQIDYDDGFNYLVCTKCGKRYMAVDLEDKSGGNTIINAKRGGKYPMKISIKYGDGHVVTTGASSATFKRPRKVIEKPNKIKVKVTFNKEEKPETECIIPINSDTLSHSSGVYMIDDSREEEHHLTKDYSDTDESTKVIHLNDSINFVEKAEAKPIEEEKVESKEEIKETKLNTSSGMKYSSGFIKSSRPNNVGEY